MGFEVFSLYRGTRERVDWYPALTVGFLYLDSVQALERAFRVKSGVQSPVGDEIEIDAEVFGEFLKTVLVALQETNNGPFCRQAALK
jgi:hypothetical protein